jgi:hypothetical protein
MCNFIYLNSSIVSNKMKKQKQNILTKHVGDEIKTSIGNDIFVLVYLEIAMTLYTISIISFLILLFLYNRLKYYKFRIKTLQDYVTLSYCLLLTISRKLCNCRIKL